MHVRMQRWQALRLNVIQAAIRLTYRTLRLKNSVHSTRNIIARQTVCFFYMAIFLQESSFLSCSVRSCRALLLVEKSLWCRLRFLTTGSRRFCMCTVLQLSRKKRNPGSRAPSWSAGIQAAMMRTGFLRLSVSWKMHFLKICFVAMTARRCQRLCCKADLDRTLLRRQAHIQRRVKIRSCADCVALTRKMRVRLSVLCLTRWVTSARTA